MTLAVLELRENEALAKLERTWWYDKGECGSDGTFMKVCHLPRTLLGYGSVSGCDVLCATRRHF